MSAYVITKAITNAIVSIKGITPLVRNSDKSSTPFPLKSVSRGRHLYVYQMVEKHHSPSARLIVPYMPIYVNREIGMSRWLIGIIERIPEIWGVLVVYADEGKFKIDILRQAALNPKATLNSKLKLLWRRELVNISFRNGLGKCSGKPRASIILKLIEHINNNKLHREITDELFERDYTIE